MASPHYQVLIPVSRGYPCVEGRLPTRYSPVRRFHEVPLAEAAVPSITLDLHVLGTPPAFILSQDQTLNEFYLIAFAVKSSFELCSFERLAFFFVFHEIIAFRNLYENLAFALFLPIFADCCLYILILESI